MGTDCAPYLANLYLFSYEFRFMNNQLKAKNYDKLHKFSRSCRYIDDLLVINNEKFMDKYMNSIYPQELTLSSDDKKDQQVNYLDLHLEIKDTVLNYKIYDKRDHFHFPITFPKVIHMEFLLLNLFVMQGDVKCTKILNLELKIFLNV
jgi:hypothetical protein